MSDINIRSSTQHIIVDPASSSVAVINAGPPGPASGSVREWKYTQITAPVDITATTNPTAQSVINPGNVDYDGSPVLIEFYSAGCRPGTSANSQLLIHLYDGNTDLGYIGQVMTPAASTMVVPVHAFRRLTPTPGTHNYNVRSWVSAGAGKIDAGAGGPGLFSPAFLRVTKA
jgi:hypothetical protein